MNHPNHEKRPPRGFTLVELLIVVTIIVILISIMVVAGGPIITAANRSSCQNQLKTLSQCYLNYTNQYSIQFPALQNPTPDVECSIHPQKGIRTYNGLDETVGSGVPPNFDNYIYNSAAGYRAGFGPLAWHKLITSGYFVCPAVNGRDNWWHGTESANQSEIDYFMNAGNLNPEFCIAQNPKDGVASNMSPYIIASYSIRPKLFAWTPAQVQMPHNGLDYGCRAFIADSFNNPLWVQNRHKDGVCVAYLDGTVGFSNDPCLTGKDPTCLNPTLEQVWHKLDATQ